jgi:hypothetical protein
MDPLIVIITSIFAGGLAGAGPLIEEIYAAIKRVVRRSSDAKLALEEISTQADELAVTADVQVRGLPTGDDREAPSESLSLAQQDLRAAVAILQTSVRDSKQQIDFNAEEQRSAARQQLAYFVLSVLGAITCIAVVIYGVYLALGGQADIGTVTAIAGTVPGVISAMLFKRADIAEKRRNLISARTAQSVEKAQSMLRIIQMSSRLDSVTRQKILALAVLADMFPEAKPADLLVLLDEK